MKAWLPHIILVLCILGCCAVSYFVGYDKGFKRAPIKERIDTVTVRETLTVYEPKEKIVFKDKVVFVPVPKLDTITLHDTTYIALQSEKKIYEDTDYRAVVSGICPKLEEISVFPERVTVERVNLIRQRWGFSANIGPAVVWNGSFHAGIGVSVGFGYNF